MYLFYPFTTVIKIRNNMCKKKVYIEVDAMPDTMGRLIKLM